MGSSTDGTLTLDITLNCNCFVVVSFLSNSLTFSVTFLPSFSVPFLRHFLGEYGDLSPAIKLPASNGTEAARQDGDEIPREWSLPYHGLRASLTYNTAFHNGTVGGL